MGGRGQAGLTQSSSWVSWTMRCRMSTSPSLWERREGGHINITVAAGRALSSLPLSLKAVPRPGSACSPTVTAPGAGEGPPAAPGSPLGGLDGQAFLGRSQPVHGLGWGERCGLGAWCQDCSRPWALRLCTYLDLMLKFLPRETCLMDLLLPMESTSVTMSGSKPARDGRQLPRCSKQSTEVAPRWSPKRHLQSHRVTAGRCPGQLLSIFLLFTAPPQGDRSPVQSQGPRRVTPRKEYPLWGLLLFRVSRLC